MEKEEKEIGISGHGKKERRIKVVIERRKSRGENKKDKQGGRTRSKKKK